MDYLDRLDPIYDARIDSDCRECYGSKFDIGTLLFGTEEPCPRCKGAGKEIKEKNDGQKNK